jgi:hypothetical protein
MAAPRPPRTDRPVTTRALADALGVSTQFVVQECIAQDGELRGDGKSWKLGKEWRISYAAAVAFLEKRGLTSSSLHRRPA